MAIIGAIKIEQAIARKRLGRTSRLPGTDKTLGRRVGWRFQEMPSKDVQRRENIHERRGSMQLNKNGLI